MQVKNWEAVSDELEGRKDLTDEQIKVALQEFVVNRPTTYYGNYEAFYTLSAVMSIEIKRIADREGESLEKASREKIDRYEQKLILCRQAAYERTIKMFEEGFVESKYGFDNVGEMIMCILGRFLPVEDEYKQKIREAEQKYFQHHHSEALKRWMGRFVWETGESLI